MQILEDTKIYIQNLHIKIQSQCNIVEISGTNIPELISKQSQLNNGEIMATSNTKHRLKMSHDG